MPTANFPGGGTQVGTHLVNSCVYDAYVSVSNLTPVGAATASYFVGHLFSGNNGTGTDFGQCSIDITGQSIPAWSGRSSINEILAWFFPPPGPFDV